MVQRERALSESGENLPRRLRAWRDLVEMKFGESKFGFDVRRVVGEFPDKTIECRERLAVSFGRIVQAAQVEQVSDRGGVFIESDQLIPEALEKWLIVAAAGDTGKTDESWYNMVADGMDHAGAVDDISHHPEAKAHANERSSGGICMNRK